MTGTHFAIMAQGEQQRIGHLLGREGRPAFKQLLEASPGETIFGRMCRLAKEEDPQAKLWAVVHPTHDFAEACSKAGAQAMIQADPGCSVLSGIYFSRDVWGERTAILLGDVVFSRAVIREVCSRPGNTVYARLGANPVTKKPWPEIFGLTFDRDGAEVVLRALADPNFRRHTDSKLWSVIDVLRGGGFSTHAVTDWTDDIDTEAGFFKWLPILRDCVAREVA